MLLEAGADHGTRLDVRLRGRLGRSAFSLVIISLRRQLNAKNLLLSQITPSATRFKDVKPSSTHFLSQQNSLISDVKQLNQTKPK